MRTVLLFAMVLVACQRTEEKKVITTGSGSAATTGSAGSAAPPKVEQIRPPLDLANPPIDAVKTSTGLVYKKLTSVADAPAPKRNDTVLITYTGWRQSTGETFYSNRSNGQPMPLQLANTAPGFTEALQFVRKGERAMLWLPPEIGYKGAPPAGTAPETLVYEVEIVDILPAPAVPEDVGKPPATAEKLKSGLLYRVVKPGTGKEKARTFDTVTFNYSAWDADGRMFDSTEMRKRPATVPPFRQTVVMEEILTSMTAGERRRFWIPSEKMTSAGKPLPGMPAGVLTYEIEMITIAKGTEPPPVPRDVKEPPADAQKTAKGVFYKVLKQGTGDTKPAPTDKVKVHYTGWTTDGRMFDSSVVKNEPSEFSLDGVIVGWTDGLSLMRAGDRYRFWIPDELAYKGAAGRPQGMLVFDIELLEVMPQRKPLTETGRVEVGGEPLKVETGVVPPDVAAPPADAKKSPKGVFYKILTSVPGAKRPTLADTITAHYTGWTTDGKEFDSSKKSGRPLVYPLTSLIKGWQDVFPLIGVGESARIWVPEELAYKGKSGPQGMLVFDIELLDTKGP
ncbi:MAG: FKBP-type peptidyl-prolyl cis-trans isomerase [Myxococcales bacterium]|nr:FKBP-type peptidyl-prolyl cis-trans isomerase [Myxococcales bacterium]